MPRKITLDFIRPGEEESVVALILDVFDRHVAPCFLERGITEFRKYANVEALAGRLEAGAVVVAARVSGGLAGVAEVRRYRHLGMLFVDSSRQRQGIGGALIRKVLEICSAHEGETPVLTVNASPNATGFYESMGFTVRGPEQTLNGIRFVPMDYALNAKNTK